MSPVNPESRPPRTKFPDLRFWKSRAHRDALTQDADSLYAPERSLENRPDGLGRRDFVKVGAAGAALAGLVACAPFRRPEETITPYDKAPEGMVPGVPTFYASAFRSGNEVLGILVETHEGRPTKIEGNPRHPSSLGATHARAQASVLDLYDADRLNTPMRGGVPTVMGNVLAWIRETSSGFAANKGKGLAFLVGETSSPSEITALQSVKARFPEAAFYRIEAVAQEGLISLTGRSGKAVLATYSLEKADVIFALDADLLASPYEGVANTRALSARRSPEHPDGLNRVYVAEPVYTTLGGMADHRVRLSRSQGDLLAAQLVARLSSSGLALPAALVVASKKASSQSLPASVSAKFLDVLAKDLLSAKGRSVVAAGPGQSPAVHAAFAAINAALGAEGRFVTYQAPQGAALPAFQLSTPATVAALSKALDDGSIQTLVSVGVNACYEFPALTEKFARIKSRMHLASHLDESAAGAEWAVPRSHDLESWTDALSLGGAYAVVQPVIRPMNPGLSDLEFILAWAGVESTALDFVKKTAASRGIGESEWRLALHDGVVVGKDAGDSFPAVSEAAYAELGSAATKETELVFLFDPALHDGRHANNPWLQEAPHPVSKTTWGNALWVSPKLAREKNWKDGDVLEVKGARTVEIAVHVAPGTAEGVVALCIGHGRTAAGRVGSGYGVNAGLLRGEADWLKGVVSLRDSGKRMKLANVQEHDDMAGRPVVKMATLAEYRKDPDFAKVEEGPSLVQAPEGSKTYQWGMSIDLSKCTGCNACLVACQSENNIPAVGKENVLQGREMHWIRMDRYFEGGEEDPKMVAQPVACVQCENAPCEQVCPVNATMHGQEGTSDIAYNRCIGMRYCANNCPYKARRFNYFDYHQKSPQSVEKKRVHLFDAFREPAKGQRMQFNPDVTVRMRGIMEKCTYCVQRVNDARSEASAKGGTVQDGQVLTACQQSCPAQAIDFGNLLDQRSKVVRQKANPRNYSLLGELGIKPRTTYLAVVRNPHPELA